VRDTRTLRPIISLRFGRHAPSPDTTFRDLFRQMPFVLLEEGERASISGMAGRLWSISAGFVELRSPDEFRSFDAPSTVKVVVATTVRDHPRGAEIVSDVRMACSDRRARVHFRAFWTFMSPLSRFIELELLRTATRRAQAVPRRPPRDPGR
jgi:hypothetical protein